MPERPYGPLDRRQFLRATSGLLVATGLGSACTSVDGVALGTIVVSITGLALGLPDAGTAVITRTDVTTPPLNITVPAVGSGTADVPAGTYHTIYTPPAGYQVVGPNEFDVTITPLTTTPVDIAVSLIVVATQGTLRVTVTGLTAAAPDGGSAVLQRTDAAGSPITAPVPLAGSVDTIVVAGVYSVTYTPPTGFTFAIGQTGSANATVAVSQTATAAFAVAALPTGGTVGDIHEHGFEDGTFGAFRTGNNQSLATIGWALDTTTAAKGTQSLKHNIAVQSANQGYAAYYTMPSLRSSAFIRFAYRQTAGFDNSFPIKVLRIQKNFGTLLGSVIFNGDGPNVIRVHSEDRATGGSGSNMSCNLLTVPSPNALRGQWHWFELFLDVSSPTQTIFRLWVDDVKYMDRTLSHAARADNDFNQIFFGATLNSIASVGTINYDHIGIGTQKLGIP